MSTRMIVLKTGTTLAPIRARHGDFEHWFRVAAGLDRRSVSCVDLIVGEPLPDPRTPVPVVITGSAHMVTERLDWSEACADWIRQRVALSRPLLGVCYGHQLIAHACGGEVGWNPRGREIGTRLIVRTRSSDPLTAALPAQFHAHTTHQQTVLAPPPGSQVLASSELDDCQMFRIGECAWGVQFHPEFSAEVMRAYLCQRRPQLIAEGIDDHAVRSAVAPAPVARSVLRRFLRLAG